MTIKEVCEKYDITADTLRYYERVGVIPQVTRTSGGIRNYSEEDIKWVENAICMRSAGPIIVSIVEIVKNKGFGIDEEAEIKGICNISLTKIPPIILKNTFLNLFNDCAIDIDVVNIHLNNATNIVKQNTLGPQLLAP